MPIGHSAPIAIPAGAIAGVLAGMAAGAIVKEMGGGRVARKLAASVTDGCVSAAVSGAINTVTGDIGIGYGVTSVQAVTQSFIHYELAANDSAIEY